jgi:hypothetical protein
VKFGKTSKQRQHNRQADCCYRRRDIALSGHNHSIFPSNGHDSASSRFDAEYVDYFSPAPVHHKKQGFEYI